MNCSPISFSFYTFYFLILFLLSLRNALRRGYSNAAVIPWVRASVSQSVSESRLVLVNAIATKMFCKYSPNLADILTMTWGWTLLILEVGGQRSRSHSHIRRRHCEHDRDWTVAFVIVKLCRHINHGWRMNIIDSWGQRSKSKVTMDLYVKNLVHAVETEPLCASLSNLAGILTVMRGWTLLIF